FFQAEDGIRDFHVTGVQTCALPICHGSAKRVFNFGGGFEPEQVYGAEFQLDAGVEYRIGDRWSVALGGQNLTDEYPDLSNEDIRSEERRGGKECRTRVTEYE